MVVQSILSKGLAGWWLEEGKENTERIIYHKDAENTEFKRKRI
jgi:hypothetical protein